MLRYSECGNPVDVVDLAVDSEFPKAVVLGPDHIHVKVLAAPINPGNSP
jgi:hypothetical protein